MKIQIRDTEFFATDGQYDEVWKYINTGKWEPRTFEILDHFVGNGDIVLDLGAWIGAVSLYTAHLSSGVYAVEPDPVVFPYLEKNILENPGLNLKIKCSKLAISGKTEKLTLYARTQYGVSSSSLLPRIHDKLSTVQVQGMSLKEFIKSEKIKKIDFIKMDIEGGEFDLLPSITADLKKMDFPTLFISFHYHYLTEHQYFLKVKCKFLSKLMMKLESLTGIELFRKANRAIVLKTLQSLDDYAFIYTESGHEINHALVQSDPLQVIKHNLVFTDKKWL